MELASRGDPRKVDIHSNELFVDVCAADVNESLYNLDSEMEHSLRCYSFGKTVRAKKGWSINSRAI